MVITLNVFTGPLPPVPGIAVTDRTSKRMGSTAVPPTMVILSPGRYRLPPLLSSMLSELMKTVNVAGFSGTPLVKSAACR